MKRFVCCLILVLVIRPWPVYAQSNGYETIGCFGTKAEMVVQFVRGHPELKGAKLVEKDSLTDLTWLATKNGKQVEWHLGFIRQRCAAQPAKFQYVFRPEEDYWPTIPPHTKTIAKANRSTKPQETPIQRSARRRKSG